MCAEFIFIFARSFEWYLLMALLAGSGFAFASGAIEALVYDSLPSSSKVNREEAMKRAMGRVNSWGQIAFIAETSLVSAFLAMGAMIITSALLLRVHRLPAATQPSAT